MTTCGERRRGPAHTVVTEQSYVIAEYFRGLCLGVDVPVLDVLRADDTAYAGGVSGISWVPKVCGR